MSFLFQAAQTRYEFQIRQFQYSRDLYIRKNSRDGDETRTVLPPLLGKNSEGRGGVWGIAELKEHGKTAARELGIPRPSQQQIIHCGLFAAAQRCPLVVKESKVPALIRASLFQSGGLSEVAKTARPYIEERISTAVHQHLSEGTNTEFMNWLCGARSSFVKQIASQKKAPGGSYPPGVVRDVLLELGWESYFYMASCISLQMQAFAQRSETGD